MNFAWDPAPAVDCSLEGGGSLIESWQFRRGKDVVMVFKKLGPGLAIMTRAGRGPGDTAFAAPGSVTRDATGSVQTRTAAAGVCTPFALRGLRVA